MRSSSRRLALLAGLALASLLAPAAAHARSNIVFVMTDDQTASSIAFQRNVARLQAGGTTFKQAIATYPLCCPSRSTYLSGQYSHNHGVIHNAGDLGGHTRFDHSNSLPLWLQAAGYRTMHVGRYLNGYGVQNPVLTEIPPGWNDWISAVGESVFNYRRWQMNENGNVLWRPGPDRPEEHQTDFFGRRAAELIDQAAPSDQPFFLSLTFPAPHTGAPIDPDDPPLTMLATPSPAPRHRDAFAHLPLPRPPNFDLADVGRKPQLVADRPRLTPEWQAAIQENYQQELESLLSVDEAIGGLIASLERNGELDDTLFVYTSDNGFMHGEHRITREKVFPYDASLRIPLIVHGPGVPKGLALDHLVGNIDWTPTIVDAADATPGRLMDGRSLFELLDDPTKRIGRELVLENGVGANGVPMYRGLRNQRYQWIEHKRTGEYELYDLAKDPYELRNLEDLDAYADIRSSLAKRLRKLRRCRGARECSASRPSLRVAARQLGPKRKRRPRARAGARCVDRPVRLTLGGRDVDHVAKVVYYRGARRLRGTRVAPFAAKVRRRLLPRGRRMPLRALVVTTDGRRATYDRTLRTCRRR
jgi:arylsulfatase A-like enzyme